MAQRSRTRRKIAFGAALAAGAVAAGAFAFQKRQPRTRFIPKRNPASIYQAAASGPLYAPFDLTLEPMKRLILIGFEGDPDRVYIGFEPQVFDDEVTGKGFRVIAWRKDGRVDVYQQPGLKLEPRDFDMVGQGLADALERPFLDAKFEIGATGADVHVAFEDKEGRQVAVTVKETSVRHTRPFALLAPMGQAATHPPVLPLVILHGFYFVRRAGTEFRIEIDGRAHKPDLLPLPLDGSRMFMTRYSPDPFIVTLNRAHNGSLAPLARKGASEARCDNVIYDLVDNHGHSEIRRMRLGNDIYELSLEFSPPLPDLMSLQDGVNLAGVFEIRAHASVGTVSGSYRVSRRGSEVTMSMTPSGGWQPNERKWELRFLYAVQPLFKAWPKTYRWSATMTLNDDAPIMRSSWQRTG